MKITEDYYLEPAELDKLLKAAEPNPRNYLMIALQYDLGCRSGELRQLRVKDIDLERGVAHIGRNQAERTVGLSKEDALKAWPKARAKRGQRRSVVGLMIPNIGVLLKSHIDASLLKPNDLLFPGRHGPMTLVQHNNIIDKYAELAGIQKELPTPSGRKKVTSHRLRHTHIMRATHPQNGDAVRLEDVGAQVGDQLPSLQPYLNPTPDDIRRGYGRKA